MTFSDQLLAGIGSIFAAVVAALVSWQSSRTRTGRLTRTMEQVRKISELTEKLIQLEERLAGRPSDDPSKKLLTSCLQAVSDDFEHERKLLPQFQTSARSARLAMLLYKPKNKGILVLHIAFYLMLTLMLLICARSIYFVEWRWSDTVAIFVTLSFAITIHNLARALSKRR
jgi:Flp pilus assembly protein TadB